MRVILDETLLPMVPEIIHAIEHGQPGDIIHVGS